MAKVTYRNYFEDYSEFKSIESKSLLESINLYSISQEEDIYKLIHTEKIVIFLNGYVVPVDNWCLTEVCDEDLITITPVYEDMESGWFQIAIGVALIAATFVFAPYLSPLLSKVMIGMGIGFALGGVSALLFSPTLPSYSSSSGTSSQSYSWSGISTSCRADSPVPIVYGKHPVGGNVISVYTQEESEDNYLYMLIALCEGEIEGICEYSDTDDVMITNDPDSGDYPPNGPAIWIDEQALCEYNDVEWDYRLGTNTQTKIAGFESAISQFDFGVKVDTNGWEYPTSGEVDSVTINLDSDAIYEVEGSEIVSFSVKFKVSYRLESGGAWTTHSNVTWTEKSTSPVYYSVNVDFPTREQYRVWIVRTDGGESDSDYISNPLNVTAAIEKVDGNFTYPNTALLSLKIRATDQLSGGIPNVRVLLKGLKVSVPALSGDEAFDSVVYDSAQSRFEYLGSERTWDNTTFETEYTHNAMCCVRDLLLNERYGLGKYITTTDLYSSGINTAIKICHIDYDNDYVDNDHYHTWNGVLDTQQSAFTAIYEMCSGFRCWPVWYGGTVNFVIDRDETPVHTIALSNTIEFSQSFTALSEIPYRILGQFTDLEDDYNLRTMIVEANDSTLAEINEKTVGLKGITDKDKAEREAKFMLNKAINCTHIVNFKCALDYLHATAGDIVYLQNDLPQFGQGGRILTYDAAAGTITLDKTYTMGAGTDTIRYQTASNTWLNGTIDNVSGQVIQLTAWPASNPANDAVYVITNDDSTIKEFRLVSVERTTENEIEVTAIEHLSDLYTDPTIRTITDSYSGLPNPFEVPGAPQRVGVTSSSIYDGIGFILTAQAPSGTSDVVDIVVEMSTKDDAYHTPIAAIPVSTGSTKVKYIDNNLALNKTYYFKFYCRTRYKTGPAVETEHTLYKTEFALDPPDGLCIQGQDPNSHDWDGMSVTLQWNAVGSNYWADAIVSGYTVEVYKDSSEYSSNLLRSSFTSSTSFTYTYDMNYIDNGGSPHGILVFIVYTKTTNGVESAGSNSFKATNLNPDPVTGLRTELFMGGVQFIWDSSPEDDLSHYEYKVTVQENTWEVSWDSLGLSWTSIETNNFYRSLTNSEKTSLTNPVMYFKVKVFDLFGNESTEQATYGVPESLNIAATDIEDFAIDASKLFTKIPVLSGDNFEADDPTAGSISWNAHYLYFNGNEYTIASGNTDQKYVYWKYSGTMPTGGAGETNASSYSVSNTHPADEGLLETDRDFIIAVNMDGQYTMAWNSIANEVIGTAYIMDLAVSDAKIADLSADKITAGTISAPGVYIGQAILTGGTALDTALPTHLINFVQYSETVPNVDGLYLTSDCLGYVKSGTWKTYMTNDGDFYLYGTYGISGAGYLAWSHSNSSLTIKGSVTITDGTVGTVPVTTITGWMYPGTTYINGGYIQTGTINANRIIARTITADRIADGAITAYEIKADTITAVHIVSKTITADEIAAGTITADEIKAGTITADKLYANTIEAANIKAGTITSDEIYSNAGLVGGQIAVQVENVTVPVKGWVSPYWDGKQYIHGYYVGKVTHEFGRRVVAFACITSYHWVWDRSGSSKDTEGDIDVYEQAEVYYVDETTVKARIPMSHYTNLGYPLSSGFSFTAALNGEDSTNYAGYVESINMQFLYI